MNTHFRPPGTPVSTRAAEGLERRVWTLAEIEAMVAAGIIDEDERIEMIDGEVVPTSPKGERHEVLKGSLNDWEVRHLPRAYRQIPRCATTPGARCRFMLHGYLEHTVIEPHETLAPGFAPEIAVKLAELPMI